jgi:hypothetical protein
MRKSYYDHKVTVETLFTDAGLIEQTIDIAGSIHRRVLNTQEEQIRQALIALGWTPPDRLDELGITQENHR